MRGQRPLDKHGRPGTCRSEPLAPPAGVEAASATAMIMPMTTRTRSDAGPQTAAFRFLPPDR